MKQDKGSSWFKRLFSLDRFEEGNRLACRKSLRGFEQLEDRLVLSATTPTITNLPNEITLIAGQSFHYAYEGCETVSVSDMTDLSGLVVEEQTGRTVTITYEEQDASGNKLQDLGTVVIQLFDTEVPLSTDRFYTLADTGFYSGTGDYTSTGANTVHRVIDNFMYQGGAPGGDGTKASGVAGNVTTDETNWLLSQSSAGYVVFAKKSTETPVSDCQFYVTDAAAYYLDGDYNVCGFVVSGYDTIDKITAVETGYTMSSGGAEKSAPVNRVVMTNVTCSDVQNTGMLRIAATENMIGGSTQFSLTTKTDLGVTETRTITVNVLSDNYVMQSGETLVIDLPKEYKDYSVTYTVEAYDSGDGEVGSDPDYKFPTGVTLGSIDSATSSFTVTTTSSVSRKFQIKLNLDSTVDSYDTSMIINITVTPNAPTVTLSEEMGGTSGLISGDSLIYVISDVYEYSDLYFTLQQGTDTANAFTAQLLEGGVEQSALQDNVAIATQGTSGLSQVTLTLDAAKIREWFHLEEEAEISGSFTAFAWQNMPAYSDDLKSASSESVVVTLYSSELEISDSLKEEYSLAAMDLSFEEVFNVTLGTNQTAEIEAVNPVTFSFKNASTVPSGMALTKNTETGLWKLSWSPVEENDLNHEYLVTVVATDSSGRQASRDVVFDLASGPEFNMSQSATGDPLDGQSIALENGEELPVWIDLTCGGTVTLSPEVTWSASYRVLDSSNSIVTSGDFVLTNGIGQVNCSLPETMNGDYRVEVEAKSVSSSDGEETSLIRIKDFNVTVANESPIITFEQESPFDVKVGETSTWSLTATDPNGETLVWDYTGTCPEGMSLASNGELTYTPVEASAGTTVELTVRVTDAQGATDTMKLSFAVAAAGTPVDPDDPDDPRVDEPDDLGTIETVDQLHAAWRQTVTYRLEQVLEAVDRVVTETKESIATMTTGIKSAQQSLIQKEISPTEYVQQVVALERTRIQQQREALNSYIQDIVAINSNVQKMYSTIIAAASSLSTVSPSVCTNTAYALSSIPASTVRSMIVGSNSITSRLLQHSHLVTNTSEV